MTTEEEFVLGIILEEERELTGGPASGEETVDQTEDDDELYYIQDTGVRLTNNTWYSPKGEDELGGIQNLPLKVEGTLDNFLVIAESPYFKVRVSVDETDVIKDSYTDLAEISNELTHVSAYQKNGSYVVSVFDYPFRERIDTSVRPTNGALDITRIRTEAIV